MIERPLLPWHRDAFIALSSRMRSGNLPHAYLLHGPRGTGKTTFARHVAHRILCEQPTGEKACGQCQSCELFRHGHHPDLKLVHPPEGKKIIGVDQIRECVDFLQLTSNQGGYRVVILAPAEAMNVNASNALLKSLEEPPPRTLILMLSHQPGLLLATIRSRCQSLPFAAPAHAEAVDWLSDALESHQEGEADKLLQLAGGAPLEALRFADPDWQHAWEVLLVLLGGLLQRKASIVEAAAELEKSEAGELEVVLEMLLLILRTLVEHLQGDGQALADRDSALQSLGEMFTPPQLPALHVFYQRVLENRRLLAEGIPLNAKLALETMFASWARLGTKG